MNFQTVIPDRKRFLCHEKEETKTISFFYFGTSHENECFVVSCKDVRVHAPITRMKLGIPIYFIDHSEFITIQCKKILSRANNEIKCFEFSSIKRALRPHLRTIIAI